jgi:hypothetical protein
MRRNTGHWFFSAAAVGAVALLVSGCATPKIEGAEVLEDTPKAEQKKPSAADGTYHGEVFNARSRANKSLGEVGETRKEQVKEEQSFDRPASPTPKEGGQAAPGEP